MQFFNKEIYIFTIASILSLNLTAISPQLPQVIIKTIKNNTEEDIVVIDRLQKNKAITIVAGQSGQANFEVANKNVVINGSMKDVMEKLAQYVIKKTSSTNNNDEVYVHMNAAQGGVNDGSGIITGRPGTIIFKFLLAGKNGGCQMQSGVLKNSTARTVEVNLELMPNRAALANKIFALNAEYNLEEK